VRAGRARDCRKIISHDVGTGAMNGLARFGAAVALGAALAGGAGPAAADAVIAGKSAQALRCAAYMGMAGQYGFAEGHLSAADLEAMTRWAMGVLDAWVPLDADGRLAAYRTALGELGPPAHAHALIALHGDWCVRAFSPGRS
jgi:hypothetical protein